MQTTWSSLSRSGEGPTSGDTLSGGEETIEGPQGAPPSSPLERGTAAATRPPHAPPPQRGGRLFTSAASSGFIEADAEALRSLIDDTWPTPGRGSAFTPKDTFNADSKRSGLNISRDVILSRR